MFIDSRARLSSGDTDIYVPRMLYYLRLDKSLKGYMLIQTWYVVPNFRLYGSLYVNIFYS